MKTIPEMAHDYAVAFVSTSHMGMDSNDEDYLIDRAYGLAEKMHAKSLEYAQPAPTVEEFRVDWSQAPEWANYWVANTNRWGVLMSGWWYEVKPIPDIRQSNEKQCWWLSEKSKCKIAPDFNYKGAWYESLRVRPVDKEN